VFFQCAPPCSEGVPVGATNMRTRPAATGRRIYTLALLLVRVCQSERSANPLAYRPSFGFVRRK